jgi:hypothetical protein
MAHFAPGVADDSEALRQPFFKSEVVKSRNQLSFGKVAGSAENG